MTADHDLRRRRAQAHLNADPLAVFAAERARYEQELQAADSLLSFEVDRLNALITQAEDSRNAARAALEQLASAREVERTEDRKAWQGLSALLEGQPEAPKSGQLIAPAVAKLIGRLTGERNTAVEKVGEVVALLELVEPFLNMCRRMQDNQADLAEFRKDAGMLDSGILSQRANGPFMAGLVAVVRAAAALHQELSVAVIEASAKKADLRLGTELAGVPSVFKQPLSKSKPPLIKGKAMRLEADRQRKAWDVGLELSERLKARAAEEATKASKARDLATMDLIAQVNRSNDYMVARDKAVMLKEVFEASEGAKALRSAGPFITLPMPETIAWQPVDGWPAVPNIVYDGPQVNLTNGMTFRQAREDGMIVGLAPDGSRWDRNLDGTYSPRREAKK